MAEWIYISIASRDVHRTGLPESLGEELRSTIRVSKTFKKALNTGLEIAGITDPSPGYRKAIARIRAEGAITVESKQDPSIQVTVAQVKKI